MVIAINTKALLPDKLEGFGYYIEEIFSRIAKNHPEHDFYFFFDRPFDKKFIYATNIHPIVIKPQARFPLAWTIWYNWMLPIYLKRIKADVFISPDGFCSLTTSVPQCLVVHDLAFLHYPQFISKAHLRYYQKNTKRFLNKAKIVVTVSDYSRQDMLQHFQLAANKIQVIGNAANAIFQPVTEAESESIKTKYTDGAEFFIYTGSIHPRKNLINLLKAFSLFKKRLRSNMKLVIAGRLAWKTEEFTKLLATFKFRNDVIITGYLQRNELAILTASAYAMVYPSYFEGFAVPPLEALQCAVPAIVANSSAMPEVGADAYLYINPESAEDIAEKMMLIYKDENLRSRLIANGSERVKLYNWDDAAEKMWQCIQLAATTE
ncbi:glycosyltransferase family 1 protein [Lacibacter luteus]|uniref:Glycosyltransferase family 1 protein n=1 Tax=Lacibacter luteus TaxID=2508719 RepID=A0A4V1M7L6_9BACT|nr:glycosyltransferase family 1 protein [Lacibacter luteus]RXK60505.1 glycosyltransferase family 1 protein [Lacibacter luteus]